MKYILSEKAKADLINIWEYTAKQWSTDQANTYYSLIIKKFKELAKYPQIGKDFNFVRIGYRGLIVKSHIIFYRVLNNKIEVIRILHQSMDVENNV